MFNPIKKQTMKNLKAMTDSEKIIHIIKDVFKATSFDKGGVTGEQIIDKGIELGIAEVWPRNGHDGHPWYPHLAVMMGIGGSGNQEEFYLHRVKGISDKGTTAMLYIYDESHKHEIVHRNSKTTEDVINIPDEYKGKNLNLLENACSVPEESINQITPAEKFAFYEKVHPGQYLLCDDKIFWVDWIKNNPGQFKRNHKEWVKNNQEKFNEITGEASL